MPPPSGYFDLQVNGYGGVDFNQDELSAADLHRACEHLAADGVEGILATIITDHLEAMCRRLARLVSLRAADPLAARLIAGLHVEGPFLNESAGYRGAHPADAICPASTDSAQRLLDAGAGLVRLFTLAPERDDGQRVTRWLARAGVIVSAGHTNASLDELKAAADAGLSLFTHLGNGCPQQMPRHDNIIQRALSLADRIMPCFIADGVHVPFFALGNYLRCAGIDRCIIVTDAMAAAGLGPGHYRLGRWEVAVGEDSAAWAPDHSHLVGSAGTMARSEQNLAAHLGLSAAECAQLLSLNPRRLFSAG
jgi:N-acetylglucosamine-6-phosphate deacetylase